MTLEYDLPSNFETIEELREWTWQQLQKTETEFNLGREAFYVKDSHAEPPKPRNGMIVRADGTDWNPDPVQNPAGEPGYWGYEAGEWILISRTGAPLVIGPGGIDTGASGNRWGVIAGIGGDGVMEVGRYIDFHNSDADTTDSAVRLQTAGGTTDLFINPTSGPDNGVSKRIVSAINSTLAQGDILYYDGTNFVRLPKGTSGQFLQIGATIPAWATASPVHVAEGTLSAVASLDVTIPANCDMLEIEVQNWLPATDNVALFLRFSQAGSFLAGATDYRYGYWRTAVVGASTASAIQMMDTWGNAAGEIGNYVIRIFRPLISGFTKSAVWHGAASNTSTAYASSVGQGVLLLNTNAIDAVRVLFSSGNITSGRYAVRSYRYA